jgi:multiple sugar transport system permease protein
MEAKRVKKRVLSLKAKESMWGFFFISPWLLGLLVFNLYPIVANFYYSFTKYNVVQEPVWVGLANYERMFTTDRLFWKSLFNTFYYIAFRIPGWIILGILLAILLNRKLPGIKILRTIFYLPTVIPLVASSVIWMLILNPQVGFLNHILGKLGIFMPNMLMDPDWSKPAILLLAMWQVGTTMMIFLAGLQDVPETLYEAASIDGANALQQFRHITVPMLTPTIYYVVLTGIISAFQVFGSAFIMTGGGPVYSTMFYVLLLYRNAFEFFKMGYASAMAVVLFLIMLVFTILLVKSSDRWVSYERI